MSPFDGRIANDFVRCAITVTHVMYSKLQHSICAMKFKSRVWSSLLHNFITQLFYPDIAILIEVVVLVRSVMCTIYTDKLAPNRIYWCLSPPTFYNTLKCISVYVLITSSVCHTHTLCHKSLHQLCQLSSTRYCTCVCHAFRVGLLSHPVYIFHSSHGSILCIDTHG